MTNKPAKATPTATALPSETNTLLADIDRAMEDLNDIRSHFQGEWRRDADSPGYVQSQRLKETGRYLNEIDKIDKALVSAQSAILALVARNKEAIEIIKLHRQWEGPPPSGEDYFDSIREGAWKRGTQFLKENQNAEE